MAKSVEQMTALVVDTQHQILHILSGILRNEIGFQGVEYANDGNKAWRLLNEEQFDWVFCNWDLPGMSGIELLKAMREKKAFAETPFVMLSSRNDKASLMQAVEYGVTDYVIKPFSTSIIKSKFNRFLIQRETRAARRVIPKKEIRCQVIFDGTEPYKGRIANISESGCLVEVEAFSRGGTIYDSVTLRMGCDDGARDICGELVRTEAMDPNKNKGRTIIAAAFIFTDMTQEQQDVIDVIVERNS